MEAKSHIPSLSEKEFGWYSDLMSEVGFLRGAEEEINNRMGKTATWILQMEGRSGKSPRDILSNNPDYASREVEADKERLAAKEKLKILEPKLQQFDSILTDGGV
jgi:hypothetical protein